MGDQIFISKKLKTCVELSPSELTPNISERLLQKLRKQLEGSCSRYGFIKPGSLTIVKRGPGQILKQHFNGHVKFSCTCQAEVCNPVPGHIIQGQVKNKNALGFYAECFIECLVNGKLQQRPIIDIIIPRDKTIRTDIDLELIKIGDTLNIEVLGKRMHLNDAKLSVIGRFVQEKGVKNGVDADEEDADEADELDVDGDAPVLPPPPGPEDVLMVNIDEGSESESSSEFDSSEESDSDDDGEPEEENDDEENEEEESDAESDD